MLVVRQPTARKGRKQTMRVNQAIRTKDGDALVERMYQDYHAGYDEVTGMVTLRWPDGHQTTHTMRELRREGMDNELYTLPYSHVQNDVHPWYDLPYKERVAHAWKYFPAALALTSAFGPLDQAGDESPAALGAAFANASILLQSWCSCKEPVRECYYATERGNHGFMCSACRGIAQVG